MHGSGEVKIAMDMAAPDAERVLGKTFDVELIAPGVIFGEGPVWDKRTKALYFTDICGDTIYKWKPGGKHEAILGPSKMANGCIFFVCGFINVTLKYTSPRNVVCTI